MYKLNYNLKNKIVINYFKNFVKIISFYIK